MIRNLLLDWSGTLADDLSAVVDATNAIFREYGHREFSCEEFRQEFELPFSRFYARHLPQATVEELEELYVRFFHGFQANVTLLPGALAFLEACRLRGIRLFLLSTIKATHFEEQSQRLGVDHFFEHAYVEILDKREKIREILAIHQLNPSETAFVGDMVHDIETARHGGVLDIAVLTGFDPLEKLVAASPSMLIRDLNTLRACL